MTVAAGSRILVGDSLRSIAYGSRNSNSSTTTTEVGVLRVDGIAVLNGHSYLIQTSSLVGDSSVNGDDVIARLRYTTDGTSATTSSTIFGGTLIKTTASSGNWAAPISKIYHPTANETLSILLSVARAAGTGNVSILAPTGFLIDFEVFDMGQTPTDTGVSI